MPFNRFNFANNLLTMVLGGPGRSQINLQIFTQFTDSSGRQNYFSQESFRRATLIPRLIFKGTEVYTANGKQWIRHPKKFMWC